ncbi:DUF1572 domain-containing protein [Hymenobacter sp. BT175]|uniref:DUF1572 family protein n=1 Tax=Hymenobacter translucens TaxID=2886507 RepID=UPI001D0E6119|nr:DUF1572 family protein [Hymenobacter translucens]MCC2546949.1 DUF1572 domain-containing protein [Hymenobacter translucens]
MTTDYLISVRKQFAYYQQLGEKTFAQLSDEALFWQYNAESNSIATIVQHMAGNMLSRWSDFLTSDGEKEWRNREAEFEPVIQSRAELLDRWQDGWQCLYAALDALNETNWHSTIFIRNQGHSVVEAINRQLAHYPYHVGQIVFIGKMAQDADWTSLSIPRGNSQQYNAEKFAQPARKAHFTDEYLGSKKE